MQNLENALDYNTVASSIDVRGYAAALPEINMSECYPLCEGKSLPTINGKIRIHNIFT